MRFTNQIADTDEFALVWSRPPSITGGGSGSRDGNDPVPPWYLNWEAPRPRPDALTVQKLTSFKGREVVHLGDRARTEFPYRSEDDWVDEIEKKDE